MQHNVFLLYILLSISSFSIAASLDFKPQANAAAATLQKWYNQTSGLWVTTGWWNSANCLTTLANLAAVDSTAHNVTDLVFPTTFERAQQYEAIVSKNIMQGLVSSKYETHGAQLETPNGFLNGFYDDEGWWALAWIRAYDVSGDLRYLVAAEDIFKDMQGGWDTPCGGGIWWDKARTYVNAIANELFLSVAAHLANRKNDDKQYYIDWALKEWTWFQKTGMINANNTINDGLTTTDCQNNNGTVWSYNQGVILGGLVELSKATNNSSYIEVATRIALAGIDNLADDNGILREPCEPNCGGDGSQFKGIFMRNLAALHQAQPSKEIARFVEDNAASIWTSARGEDNKLGLMWAGPYDNAANASTQSSALDALVAAVAIQ